MYTKITYCRQRIGHGAPDYPIERGTIHAAPYYLGQHTIGSPGPKHRDYRLHSRQNHAHHILLEKQGQI